MIPAVLVTDTREQRPYLFEGNTSRFVAFEHRRAALPEGDYAARLPGDDSPEATCVVERKSLPDLFGSLTHDRPRFIRECERLTSYGMRCIVVEGDIPGILERAARRDCRVNPKSLIASIIVIQQRYGIHVAFCSTRQYAEAYTYRLLERWVRDRAAAHRKAQVVQCTP